MGALIISGRLYTPGAGTDQEGALTNGDLRCNLTIWNPVSATANAVVGWQGADGSDSVSVPPSYQGIIVEKISVYTLTVSGNGATPTIWLAKDPVKVTPHTFGSAA